MRRGVRVGGGHVALGVVVMWLWLSVAGCEDLLLGYMTGSQRLPGDLDYPRPGLTISGAISLAVDELNNGLLADKGHTLSFIVAETYGDETMSIKQTAALWTQNVTAYIGPQETCVHEAKMAAAFNLAMISYFCTNYETSDKRDFPTFARTRPPDTQISKSVASVLLAFNWTQVMFFYLNATESELGTIADTTLNVFEEFGIRVVGTRCWDTPYFHGYMDNPFHKLVAQTYQHTRIYVILGEHSEHIGLVAAMEELGLFNNGEYWVVGVDIEQYDEGDPGKYVRGLLQDEIDPMALRGFRSYLGVVPSPPRGFHNFSLQVNDFMEKPPFNFPNPVGYLGGVKLIRAEAAYLYDAVKLYTQAFVETLEAGEDPRNGTAVVNRLKHRHYHSAMGYMVYMDNNGDAEGNYTLLGLRTLSTGQSGMHPVGLFTYGHSDSSLPELHLTSEIHWINGVPPIAEPPCGFTGEKCITHTMEIAGGIAGAGLAIVVLVALVLYRNWQYEQELDSLLWKVDFREIQMNDADIYNQNSPGTKVTTKVN